MAEFAYLYREVDKGPASPQEMQERLKNWTAWFQDLQAKGHIKQRGVQLIVGAATVKGRERQVHDGLYAESKDIVMGVTTGLKRCCGWRNSDEQLRDTTRKVCRDLWRRRLGRCGRRQGARDGRRRV